MIRTLFVSSLLLLLFASIVSSRDMKFRFVNPTFGGDSFNSSHLLGLAEIQKDFFKSDSAPVSASSSQSDLFVRQLQSRLLSGLSAGLSEAITGAKSGESDTIRIGDQEIFYSRNDNDINVTITNLLDGSVTEIELPVVE
jgi:curli production assembly/transport component CsgF